MAEEAGEEERHGQRDAADAEENEADEFAHVQGGVVALGAGVNVPLTGRLILAYDLGLGRHQIADQDPHHPEQQQVDAHPHEDLPPDGRTAPAPWVRVQQVRIVVVFVDRRVLVASVSVVELMQVRLHAEVHGTTPLPLGSRARARVSMLVPLVPWHI